MERYSIDSFILDERELAEHYKESGNEDGYKGKSKLVEFLEELKSYKKAKENGMLIHLPCRVGDTVYRIKDCGLLKDTCETDCYSCKDICPYEGREYERKYEIVPWKMESVSAIVIAMEQLGKTVFLTSEEAEQALAKMGE